MQSQLLHTPEGMRDIYGTEEARKRRLEQLLYERLRLGGYQSIQTPGFEFFDVFRKERGTVPMQEMYRFFDREGNTLVLRPDFTPSIARCVAKYYREEKEPLRFCYQGSTYVNNSGYQGKPKETTQIGVELLQDGGAYADAEVLALAVEVLRQAGLEEFQLEVGNAGFFAGIIAETTLPEEAVLELRTFIEDKYSYGVDNFLAEHQKDIPEGCQKLLHLLPECFGSMEDMQALQTLAEAEKLPGAREALLRLKEIERILSLYGCSGYITYDLGMLGKLNYYTGLIFRGYTYGTGEAIVSGGRYDHLAGQFGKDVPAVGMAVNVDLLLFALARQKIDLFPAEERVLVLCDPTCEAEGIRRVQVLRAEGVPAVLQIEPLPSTEKNHQEFTRIEQIKKGGASK